MKALREEQVAQALRYCEEMKVAKALKNPICWESKTLYKLWAEMWDCPELEFLMEKLEEDGRFPYYVTHEMTSFGECYSILIVSPYEEDFNLAYPRYDEKSETWRVYAYVYNKTHNERSESGSILVKNKYGILYRIL